MSTPTCGELSCDECNARTAALTAERDQLRAALALGQQNCDDAYDDLRAERAAAIARAERAEAELATEREKVRGLHKALKNIKNSICRIVPDGYSQPCVDESADECDRIIDAAMKEGAK